MTLRLCTFALRTGGQWQLREFSLRERNELRRKKKKESWALKNGCFWTVVLEKTLQNPLDSKEIKLVNPKGNQPWLFIGRTDVETGAPIPPDSKNWLIGKDPNAGKDLGKVEKGKLPSSCGYFHSHWEKVYPLVHHSSNGVLSFREFMTIIF